MWIKAVVLSTLIVGALSGVVPVAPVYKPVPIYAAKPLYAPDPYYEKPKPYDFGYETVDEFGSKQHRQETADGTGAVTGSYGYVDPWGIYRQVDYVADELGYRATVKTNEPGTANQNPASVNVLADPVPAAAPPPKVYVKPVVPVVKKVVPAPYVFGPAAYAPPPPAPFYKAVAPIYAKPAVVKKIFY